MAIAFDSSSFGNTGANNTSVTWSHTCSGANRILFVGVSCPSTRTISSVTYNGVGMTNINRSSGSQTVALYYLIAPATGANNVVVTVDSSTFIYCDATSYTGVKQSSQPDANNTSSTTSTTVTTSVTTIADNCWSVLIARGESDGVTSAGTGSTSRVSSSGYVQMYDSNGNITPAGSYSMSTTQSSQVVTQAMASFSPDGGYTLTCDTGTFTLTGIDTTFRRTYVLVCAAGSFALTGIDALFKRGYGIICEVGSFILTGIDATLRYAGWTRRTKPSSSWSDRTKPTTTYTDRTKPTTNWTNR